MRTHRSLALIALHGVLLALPGTAVPAPAHAPQVARSTGDAVPLAGRDARRAPSLSSADTITVYHADLEALSSPGNEGGFTHVDESGVPTAWNIGTTYSCEGNSFWCGIVDSSWTGDPNRRGYANGWTQTLGNFADLSGAASPYKMGFRHKLDVENGFDVVTVEVNDLEESWVPLKLYTGVIPSGGAGCDTVTFQIPDSIVAETPTVQFRFVLKSDLQGSSADGLYPGEGWSIDNVTVWGGFNDIRFFDDFEAGVGTWQVSTFPPVGDFWRITDNALTQQLCTTNDSKVWSATNPLNDALVPGIDDRLISPPVFVNAADQVFFSFDVYRDLPLFACFYYEVAFRSREPGGAPWSEWVNPSDVLYFGNEREWMRQTVPLPGAAGAESVQVRIAIKDYSAVFCDGQSTSGGTAFYVDNLDIRVLGQSGPTIATTEAALYQDTFSTTAFFGNDNFNTPRGDSVTVQIGASRGLKQAFLHHSLNGAPFSATALVPFGPGAPGVYHADVPAGAYPRGTQLRYYFSATDSLDETATLPADALSQSHYFAATVLPGIHAPTAFCPDDTARVLYVNAFAGPDAVTGIDQALGALGVRYDRFDVNAAASGFGNTPGGGDPAAPGLVWPGVTAPALGSYRAIVWEVGERSSATLNARDQTLLQSWFGMSGRNRGVVLSGDNLAFDLVANAQEVPGFLACVAGAAYQRDVWENAPQDTLNPTSVGASGTRLSGEPFPLNGDCPDINRFDAFSTAACAGGTARAWLRWPNNLLAASERLAALASAGDSARSVLFGFSLAAIPSAARRNLLLWRTLVEEMEVPFCAAPTAVESPAAPAAPAARLHAAAPNPFNPATTLRFTLGRGCRVRMAVYDVAGALVRVLADAPFQAGEHRIRWDGRDDRGRPVGSAAYFIRFTAEGQSEARKVVLLR